MRLIDATEAIRISKEDKYMWVYDLTDLEEFLAGVPTIEAVPVKHGKWESVEAKPHMIYSCSSCGEKWGYGAVLHMNYCPNCGAKMDGDQE